MQREKLYELWFRAPYKNLIRDKKLTLALRPGDRSYPNPKGVREGEIARVRIITKPGDEARGIQPEFDSFETPIRIKEVAVKRLGELETNELIGYLPGCQDRERARHELGLIYNREFKDDEIVSILRFEYINDVGT